MKGFFMLLAMVAQASLIFNDDHIDVAKVDYEDGGFLSRFARDLPDGSGDETGLGSPEDAEITSSTPSTDTNEVKDTTEVLEDGTGVTVTPADTTPSAQDTTTTASTEASSSASSTTEKPTTKSSSSSGQINSFTLFFPVLVGVFFCF